MRARVMRDDAGLAPDPLPLPLTRHARAAWLREKAKECVRQADELKLAGEVLDAMAELARAEEYAALARTRAVEETANG
jgi:hypothetical protein